jgi:hypothetical protein
MFDRRQNKIIQPKLWLPCLKKFFLLKGSYFRHQMIPGSLKNPCIVIMLLLRSIKEIVENYNFKNKIPALALTVACTIIAFIVYFSIPSDTIIFLIFVSLVPIFALCRFEGRIPIGTAVLLLILAAGLPGFELPLALFSYWLLLVGITCLLIDLIRNKK